MALPAFVALGPEAIRADQALGSFVTGVASARTPDDLDAAGQHLATVVTIVGLDTFLAFVTHKAGPAVRDALPEVRSPAGAAQAVTPDGVEVPVAQGDGSPPPDSETQSTTSGKTAHKQWSDAQRASTTFDEVGGAIDDASGQPVKVPHRASISRPASRSQLRRYKRRDPTP